MSQQEEREPCSYNQTTQLNKANPAGVPRKIVSESSLTLVGNESVLEYSSDDISLRHCRECVGSLREDDVQLCSLRRSLEVKKAFKDLGFQGMSDEDVSRREFLNPSD